LKILTFTGVLACEEIRTKDLVLSQVNFSIDGKEGVFDLNPVTMRVFGGQGSGDIRADFSGSVPEYHVRYSLSKFHLAEFFKTLSPRNVGDGPTDFSANMSMKGKTTDEIVRSAGGEASLHAHDLTLGIGDIDKELSSYESSQSFNLVDVGAFFFAGSLGVVITKGYNFANIFQSSRGSSQIRTLVSKWNIEHGVAQAKDVAMATKENRIALNGELDFVNGRFREVTVALIDAQGCPRVQQKIRGSFSKPEVERPSILTSLTGPTRKLLRHAESLFGGPCDVFYAGSVAPPH
jgi:AsmA protein